MDKIRNRFGSKAVFLASATKKPKRHVS